MIKIAGIVLITLVIAALIKQTKPEFYIFIIISGALFLFYIVFDDLSQIADKLGSLSSSVSFVQPYIKLMFKVLGVSLLSQLASDICRDCGETALASQSETASKILILAMSLPLFETVINMITGMLK